MPIYDNETVLKTRWNSSILNVISNRFHRLNSITNQILPTNHFLLGKEDQQFCLYKKYADSEELYTVIDWLPTKEFNNQFRLFMLGVHFGNNGEYNL